MARIQSPGVVSADTEVFFPASLPERAARPSGYAQTADKMQAIGSTVAAAKPLVDLGLRAGQGIYRTVQDIAADRLKAIETDKWYAEAAKAQAAGLPEPPKPSSMQAAPAAQASTAAPQPLDRSGTKDQQHGYLPPYTSDNGIAFPEVLGSGESPPVAERPASSPTMRAPAMDAGFQRPSVQDIAGQRLAAVEAPDQTDRDVRTLEGVAAGMEVAPKFYGDDGRPRGPASAAARPLVGGAGPASALPEGSLAGAQGNASGVADTMPASTAQSLLGGTRLGAGATAALSAPTPVQKAPATLGAATPEQLQRLRQRVAESMANAKTPDEQELWQERLSQVDDEIANRDEGPLEPEQFYDMARGASDTASQQKVLAAIGRVRAPLSIDSLLNPGAAKSALMREAFGLFPVAPKRTAEEQAADAMYDRNRGLLAAGQVEELEARRAERIALDKARAAQALANAGRADAVAADTAGQTAGKNAERASRAAKLDAEAKTINDHREAIGKKIAADAAKINAAAAKLRRPPSKGIRAGLGSDEIALMKIYASRDNGDVKGLVKVSEDAARLAADREDDANRAEAQAQLLATAAGDPPSGAEAYDPSRDFGDAAKQKLANLEAYNKRKAAADAAVTAVAEAKKKAAAAVLDRQAAQAAAKLAQETQTEARQLVDLLATGGVPAFRQRLTAKTAPAAGVQPAAPAPAAPEPKAQGRVPAPKGASPGQTIRQKSTGKTFKVAADGYMDPV